MPTIADIQRVLGVKADGAWGPMSQAAFDAVVHPGLTPAGTTVHSVLASTFADPKDIEAFRRAKLRGLSDSEAFDFGDNGVGKWQDDTTRGSGPSCALPPEDWEQLPHPRNALVEVTCNGHVVQACLRDTMPHRRNITNGCGIDMNPDLCDALGVAYGGTYRATWRFL